MLNHIDNQTVTRRGFLGALQRIGALFLGGAALNSNRLLAETAPKVNGSSTAAGEVSRAGSLTNRLAPEVQMQFMRPGQLESALRQFPVVYVPFGLIEWHGRHLPLGNDALKAHAIWSNVPNSSVVWCTHLSTFTTVLAWTSCAPC